MNEMKINSYPDEFEWNIYGVMSQKGAGHFAIIFLNQTLLAH